MRDAPALTILPILQQSGAFITAYDPAAMVAARPLLSDVVWAQDSYAAAKDADALVIITEWNEFRALDLHRLKGAMAGDVIVDLRNIYRPAEMEAAGVRYFSIGRKAVEAVAQVTSPQKKAQR
jgi:UDPglucose 6-dehydrogenase